MLYYFNFVQGSFFGETDANTKKACVEKLVPRALWWFRWGAMVTFLSGWLIIMMTLHSSPDLMYTTWGLIILVGAALGSLMWANVWFVIWPNQKIVIGMKPGDAAAAGAKALLCSRTNVMFSVPMLFFMGAARHLSLDATDANVSGYFITMGVIIGALELNSLVGKIGYLKTVRGVITCGFILAAVLYGVAGVS